MSQPEHSKIITKAAKQIFKPHGLEQMGQSQTWFDDQGLYTTIIEFQPHKWEHGAFLNVGVNFHWYEQEYTSFDIGYRETGFEKFETSEQFTSKIEDMVRIAMDKALSYRVQLINLSTVKKNILAHNFTSETLWGNYHKGVISGLTNDADGLNKYFDELLLVGHDVEWANELKSKVRQLKEIASDSLKFKNEILRIIHESRGLKKLKTMEVKILNASN
jgi:hypothetical protein